MHSLCLCTSLTCTKGYTSDPAHGIDRSMTPTFGIRTGKSPAECYCSQHPQWSQGGAWDPWRISSGSPFWMHFQSVWVAIDKQILGRIYQTPVPKNNQTLVLRHVQQDGKVIPESADVSWACCHSFHSQCQPYQTICPDARPRVSYSFHDLVPWWRSDSQG